MKKIILFVTVFMLIFTVSILPAYASEVEEPTTEEIVSNYNFYKPYDYYNYYVLFSTDFGALLVYSDDPDFSDGGNSGKEFSSFKSALKYLEDGTKENSIRDWVGSIKIENYSVKNLIAGNVPGYSKLPFFAYPSKVAYSLQGMYEIGNPLSEVISLLPVCLVCLVGFISLRKAISFVKGVISNA